MRIRRKAGAVLAAAVLAASISTRAWAYEGSPQDILKQGLFGAGVGALSAEFSGGKAGKGALIGAGTQILGGVVMSLLSQPSQTGRAVYAQPVTYVSQPTYAAPAQQVYYEPQPVYVQPAAQPASYALQPDANKKVLRDGLVGAGVGAIAAEASGGKAGTGALVGAGTNVLGSALSGLLFEGADSGRPAGYYAAPQGYASPYPTQGLHKRVVRKFDPSGKIVSEEEFWE